MPRPVAALSGLESYAVPRPRWPTDLRLDGNEGAPPPAALFAALSRAGPEAVRRYPDQAPLATAIAERFGLVREQVLVTAGADEALDRVCRAFLEPGREILLPEPGFEMLDKYARLAGATVRAYEWTEPVFPQQAVTRAVTPKTAVVALVSPNNPTGLVLDASDLAAVAAAAPDALLLVDLAYAEFAGDDLMPAALALENAVVCRSLSKSWGIAGLRTGFACGDRRWIDPLRVAGSPYSVPGPSLVLAEAWLGEGELFVRAFVAAVRQRRAVLSDRLRALGAKVWPSQANFVLARFADGAAVHEGLARHGIAVRAFPGRRYLENCLRITVPWDDAGMERLLAALDALP